MRGDRRRRARSKGGGGGGAAELAGNGTAAAASGAADDAMADGADRLEQPPARSTTRAPRSEAAKVRVTEESRGKEDAGGLWLALYSPRYPKRCYDHFPGRRSSRLAR